MALNLHLRSEAFVRGYNDFKAGKRLADNPYWLSKIEQVNWKLGWGAARDEANP